MIVELKHAQGVLLEYVLAAFKVTSSSIELVLLLLYTDRLLNSVATVSVILLCYVLRFIIGEMEVSPLLLRGWFRFRFLRSKGLSRMSIRSFGRRLISKLLGLLDIDFSRNYRGLKKITKK